jgi:hypothetical protein
MTTSHSASQWKRTGFICGLAALLCYFIAAFVPLPDGPAYLAAFAFGPLLSIGFIGLYFHLSREKNNPLLQISTLLSVVAGFMVLLMLTVQQSIFATLEELKTSMDENNYSALGGGLNSVQLGIDVAWDVLIAAGAILLSIYLLSFNGSRRIFGGAGLILGLLLLGYNLYYFPTPPAEANTIDWGPFVAIWFGTLFIKFASEKQPRDQINSDHA